MKRLLPLLVLPLLLSGCLGDLIEFSCMFSDDPDHCYQAGAVQEAEPDNCEKISGEGFSGSNPPKDKCYLQIAENTGDPSVCDQIVGGMMSYSKEECLESVFRNHTASDCTKAADEAACRQAWARNGQGCGDGYVYKDGACATEASASSEEATNPALTDAALADINTIGEAAKGRYMELLEADIEGETDPGRLAGLQAYKDFLDKGAETIEEAQANLETLEELKKIFIDSYDPANDIERMSVNQLLGPGLFDKIQERLLGPDDPLTGLDKENADAENSLTVYEAMLKQQGDNDFLKKGKLERLSDTVVSKLKDAGAEKVTEGAKEIVEGVAGTAMTAVTVVGDALQSFQDEAQQQMFLGLARAYNRRRDAITQQNPNLSSEQIHQLTVQQVQDDPYQDNTQLAVIKHGNILENKNCADEANPLCIDPHVWWTAMDKTYQYNQQ